jgi:serine/threonine protein kinase
MQLEALPGALLDQKYKIDRQLGKGSMGAVFQATHLGTMRTVALKVIVPKLAAEAQFAQRFKREAEAAGRLRHPNVVNVTDFGITRVDDSELAYMVMEYLGGEGLSGYLKKEPRPAFDFILELVDQTALALDAAHAAGIVHRDLKPSNIWLEPNHRGGYNVKVLDFGIAKVSDPIGAPAPQAAASGDDETILMMATVAMSATQGKETPLPSLLASPSHLETAFGTLLGTPAYMAPEQCQGAEVDARADTYSLATIVYEMLCSRLPFQAGDFAELVRMQVNETPQSPRQRDASVPAALSDAVMSGLAKDPAARPPSAGAFASRLRAVAEGELTPIRKSKDLVHTYLNCFLPLLAACAASLAAVLMLVWLAAHFAFQAKAAPATVLFLAVEAMVFALILFTMQVFKAGCSLVILYAEENHQFRPMLGTILTKLLRGLPALLRTHLLSMSQLAPRSFRDNLLWPVIWAREGLSGKEALDRSHRLSRGWISGAATGLTVRQYAPAAMAVLAFPSILMLTLNGSREVWNVLVREVLSSAGIGLFFFLYPLIFLMFLLVYCPAFTFLYWSALLCHGEGADAMLPASGRDDQRRRPKVRPSTLVWTALPMLLLASFLFKILRSDAGANLEDAAEDGRRAAVVKTLNTGISANYRRRNGETPLFDAVRMGDSQLAGLLFSRGADVNVHNRDGATPLLIAAADNRIDMVRLLLDRGAAINASNEDGRTALIEAAMRGNLPIAQLLLERGADARTSDIHDKTALAYAQEEGNAEMAALLHR